MHAHTNLKAITHNLKKVIVLTRWPPSDSLYKNCLIPTLITDTLPNVSHGKPCDKSIGDIKFNE